ncbi:MarR family winged helix-turn-helix transcriptional regulator [Ruegeria arenilitoris]|uniref:MarR family winged helix-turn-helix transcriptional regulator n=1 Tax=Ruegeria arenilitoris TaxID=1173585 RepID=UPI0014809ADE|nr:MarR family winged helix-turn-helix transcriptional regulator [Ruegeria arenilitoris]
MKTKGTRALLRMANSLVQYDKDMPLTRLPVFLNIALKDGIIVRELMENTGLAQSTISRTLGFLADKPVRGTKEGLNWIEMHPDPVDPRRVTLHLTAKGKEIIAQLGTASF